MDAPRKEKGLSENEAASAATGIHGLDDVLGGGLTRGRVFLLEGSPGTGKTTVALQFLLTGAAAGERTLYITLSETEDELRASAASHGWSLDGIEIFELVPPESLLDENQQQSLLYSSDLELGETTKGIFDAFERVKPDRVVVDSLSEIRLLAQSSLRYRRQILALKHYFARQNATVLMLDDLTSESNDKTVHSVAHGVIALEEMARDYGAERRRMRVVKYRGRRFRGGYHDLVIETGGLRIFPRLVSAEHKKAFKRDILPSDLAGINALLGGGVERGSSVLILGPAGTGKSLLTLNFVVGAAKRGERSAMFVFDEELGLLFNRAKGLGIDLQADDRRRPAGDRAGRRDRAQPRGALRAGANLRRGAWRPHGHHRQPQRLPDVDAGGDPARAPHARAAPISEPPGRDDLPHRRPARPGRRHEIAGRRHLSCRHGNPAPLFRGARPGAAGDVDRQEKDRRS